jgi:hypothetical protein
MAAGAGEFVCILHLAHVAAPELGVFPSPIREHVEQPLISDTFTCCPWRPETLIGH